MSGHSHWNTVQPTIMQCNGLCYQVPDHVACNWLYSGNGRTHIKCAFCVHPDLFAAVDGHVQYDSYWQQWIDLADFVARRLDDVQTTGGQNEASQT